MGNTKTYYIEGELLPGVTLEEWKDAASNAFHFTYCAAEIVEITNGYLGVTPGEGPFLIAAIHSYSLAGDQGPALIAKLFKNCKMHRLDADWSDWWYVEYENGTATGEYRSESPLHLSQPKSETAH